VAGAVEEAAQAAFASHGRIDILVNNAGVLGEVKPIWETTPENFQRVLQVNLFGTYLVTRSVVGLMRHQAPRSTDAGGHPLRGHVVNIASIQGKEGMPMASAYSASKAGMIALTKSVARDTATDGIMVTAVTPSAAETAMAKEISAERRAEIMARIPMGRFVEVDEVARMVLWLSSDDCSFSTGGIFDLSGGRASY
jgi:3-oxoacyl-[acyl-carrier protein] reductase